MIIIHYVQKLQTVLLHPVFIVTLLQLYLSAYDRFNCLIFILSLSVFFCLLYSICVQHLLRIKRYSALNEIML